FDDSWVSTVEIQEIDRNPRLRTFPRIAARWLELGARPDKRPRSLEARMGLKNAESWFAGFQPNLNLAGLLGLGCEFVARQGFDLSKYRLEQSLGLIISPSQ